MGLVAKASAEPEHGPAAANRGSAFGDGQVLAWILVVAFALALYTVYEYWRTGSFGNTYFLSSFVVLATLILASVFLAVRSSTRDVAAPDQSSTSRHGQTSATASPAPARTSKVQSDVRFVRRTVAFDDGPLKVIRSEFDVHSMPVREYEFVTTDGAIPLEHVEAALDDFRLTPAARPGVTMASGARQRRSV